MIPFILGFICGFAFFVLIQAVSLVLNPKDKKNVYDDEWQSFVNRYSKSRGLNIPFQPTVPKMPVDSEKKIKCNGNVAQEK